MESHAAFSGEAIRRPWLIMAMAWSTIASNSWFGARGANTRTASSTIMRRLTAGGDPPTSDRDGRSDRGIRVVVLDRDVIEGELEQRPHRRVEAQPRQGPRLAGELESCLLEMVEVQVRIAEGVHEVPRLQARGLRDHMGEKRVGRNVEGHAEEGVGRPLVEVAGQPALGDVELEQAMAGCEGHAVEVRRVPRGHDEPTRVGVAPNLVEHPADLVDAAAVGLLPGAPLLAVDRPEVPVRVGPLVPDRHAAR